MENNINDPRLATFGQTIVELVVETWEKEKRALPLARLGLLLSERKMPISQVLGATKLKAFIESELSALKVISHPTLALTLAAVPVAANLEGDISQYFKSTVAPKVDSLGRPRLNSVFWMAFTRPIAADSVRTVDIEPVQRFQDVTVEAAEASGKPKILPNQIVEISSLSDADERTRVTTDAAIAWADSNGIPRQYLHTKTVQAHRETSNRNDNVLSRMIRALSEEELKSVSMPLSVVKRLLESD